ncbi:MAG: VanW family protein [Clostridiaceae bacterium]
MRKSVVTGIVLVVLVIGGFGFYNYARYEKVKRYEGLVYPKVSLNNVDLSEKTKDELRQEVENLASNHLTDTNIQIQAPEKQYDLKLEDLKVTYNIDETVEKIFNYGKDLSNSEKLQLINNPKEVNFNLDAIYDENVLNSFVDNVVKETNRPAENASVSVSESKIQHKSHKIGYTVDRETFKSDIINILQNGTEEPLKVAVSEESPKVTNEQLSDINAKVSSYSTNFTKSPNPNREHNIKLAAKKINGVVLLPDEMFSFNSIVGSTSEKEGYKKAPTIVQNKIVDGFGGGICQVSSTLYSAILHANVKAVERTNHNLPVAYIPLGLDATIAEGSVDYKFKNTLGYPMYIESLIQGGNVIFNIYSNSELTQKTYKARNELYATFEPKTVEEYDESMAAGTKKVAIYPAQGHKVRVYLDTIENGNVTNTELISDNHYYPIDKVIKIGVQE